MRKVTCFVLAAVLAAAPASAQNEPVADNTADVNAATTVPVGNDVMVANDVTALPPEPVATTETAPPEAEPAPAPRSRGGFPWGVIGLVGLVGLLGRRRRD
jgi:MYXO-CTERM domain-containing protein